MSILIKLKDNIYGINKSKLLQYFPKCLFSVILEQDPSTDMIEITQPFVDNESLSLLTYIINTGIIPRGFKPSPTMKQVGDYLGISLLCVLSNSKYEQYLGPDLLQCRGVYDKDIIHRAIYMEYLELLQYFFEMVPICQSSDQEWLLSAIHCKHDELIPMFIKRGVEVQERHLKEASLHGSIPTVQMILECLKGQSMEDGRSILYNTIHNRKSEIALILLEDGRFPLSEDILNISIHLPSILSYCLAHMELDSLTLVQLLYRAIRGKHYESAEILLGDKRIDPNHDEGKLLQIVGNDLKLFGILLDRSNINMDYIKVIARDNRFKNIELTYYILKNIKCINIRDIYTEQELVAIIAGVYMLNKIIEDIQI